MVQYTQRFLWVSNTGPCEGMCSQKNAATQYWRSCVYAIQDLVKACVANMKCNAILQILCVCNTGPCEGMCVAVWGISTSPSSRQCFLSHTRSVTMCSQKDGAMQSIRQTHTHTHTHTRNNAVQTCSAQYNGNVAQSGDTDTHTLHADTDRQEHVQCECLWYAWQWTVAANLRIQLASRTHSVEVS